MTRSVVIDIGGRPALPIRALPFVTAWAESPDSLVRAMCREPTVRVGGVIQQLAGRKVEIQNRMALQAYLHHADNTYTPISHLQWQSVALELTCLTQQLQADERPDAEGENHARWRHAATMLLPTDGFVWLDDFQQWFVHTRPMVIPSEADLELWRIQQAAVHDEDDLALVLDEGMSDFARPGQIDLTPLIPTNLKGHLWHYEAAPVSVDTNVGGRPSADRQVAILVGILGEFEKLGGLPDGPRSLRGSIADLHDACQRLEQAVTRKTTLFQVGDEAFRKWLSRTNYRFRPGRAPLGEQDYWTRMAPRIQVNNLHALFFT